MDAERRVVIFDTSGINALRDDPNQKRIVERLETEFHVRISESSLLEVSGTRDSEARRKLLDLCERLLHFGECIIPYHWIITEMASCNTRYKERFEWRDVDVRASMIEEERNCRETACPGRRDSRRSAARLKGKEQGISRYFRDARERFRDAFDGEQLPSITELIRMAKADGGTFWKHAASQYDGQIYLRLVIPGSGRS
jgi:hypothetical protein